MPPVPLRRQSRSGHLVVCGAGPLARRLVEELTTRYGEEVTVVVPARRGEQARRMAALPGARLVEAQEVDEDALRAAAVRSARAIAFTAQDDEGNIHAALLARELNPEVRLVLHVFNDRLGRMIRSLLGDTVTLTDSGLAAPSFVAGAMGDEIAPAHVRLTSRTLYATRRDRAGRNRSGDRVVCGLADRSGPEPDLLPADQERADLVLAVADGTLRDPFRTSGPRRGLTAAGQHVRNAFAGRLRAVLPAVLVLLVLGSVLFARFGGYGWGDAVYLTLLDLAGAAEPDPEGLGAFTKVVQVVVTLLGIAIIPLLTASVVDSVVRARLQAAAGRRRVSYRGHVVVIGLGNVGTQVARRLHDLGVPAVGVESSEAGEQVRSRRAEQVRSLGVPVIVGDGTREDVLRLAAVGAARAVMAVTSDDVTNLEAGLAARGLREDVRLVLRIGDDDLARRIHQELKVDISRSVAYLAAPAFAAAMLQREVIGTIPVGRKVLLVANVPVQPGSPLDGREVGTVNEAGEARVVALRRPAERTDTATGPDWDPAAEHRLGGDDTLVLVATRAGLGRVLAESLAPAR